ncbi:hypothetical protein BB2000_3091 [Proteus mirabilis BB2000]|nr:hypothetical protein BB2000_3091 [Proteus mirabilis BB2000]
MKSLLTANGENVEHPTIKKMGYCDVNFKGDL